MSAVFMVGWFRLTGEELPVFGMLARSIFGKFFGSGFGPLGLLDALDDSGKLRPLHDFDGVKVGKLGFDPALGSRLLAGVSELVEDGDDGFCVHGGR
jgi:hypothetical protein